MAYGQSILSNVPADWVVVNGELTSSTMTLHANGSALLSITIDTIEKLPETAEVTIVAGTYSIYNRVEVIAVLQDNQFVAHTLPIVDIGNGIYKAIIEFPEEAYSSFIFKVSSKEGVEITEWSLATPASADFTEVIDGVKQEIPKLLWDYNTYPFQVGQEEETIGMISAKLLKNVDLQGHLQINCTASEDSTVVVRISDNEIQELYSPIEFNVKRGRNAIGIPHAYIARLIGIHNFIVTLQVKTGTVTVETRGVLYTIDGGYLAQRIIDVGYELYDITLKQLTTDQDPSKIYAVCIDDGKALIRSRVYNGEVAVAWSPEYIIEDAVAAAIEFHGTWVLRDGEQGFTLETDDYPHVMWIDSIGRLWDQYGPDVTTKFLMAEGVSYLSACMAYNYASDIQYDQGIVCAYIKAGVVYYKNLCRTNLLGGVLWSAEREITTLGTGNKSVTVARLNDYRVAINAVNSRSQWVMSNRGYVGQGVRPEHICITMKPTEIHDAILTTLTESTVKSIHENVAISVLHHGQQISSFWGDQTLPTTPVFSFIETQWVNQNTVVLISRHPMYVLDNILHNFRAYTASRPCTILSATLETPYRLHIEVVENLAATETLTVNIGGSACLQFKASNYCRIPIQALTIDIPSPLLSKKEYVNLSVDNVNIPYSVYTTINTLSNDRVLEYINLSMQNTSVTNTVYTQIGDFPV